MFYNITTIMTKGTILQKKKHINHTKQQVYQECVHVNITTETKLS